MPIVEWKESYSLKNEALDKQHKKLLGILNRLYDDFMEGVNDSAYETTIDKLLAYADYHFKTEEQLMDKMRHAHTYSHLQQHKVFYENIRQLKETAEHSSKEQSRELIEFLVNWVVQHMVVEDGKIVQ